MEDTRNKGEERAHRDQEAAAPCATLLLKPPRISAPSTVLLLPGAANTTRRLAGRPCDNATAVPMPREWGLSQDHTLGSLSGRLSTLSWSLPTCLWTGGCSAAADDASRERRMESKCW